MANDDLKFIDKPSNNPNKPVVTVTADNQIKSPTKSEKINSFNNFNGGFWTYAFNLGCQCNV